MKPSFVLFLNHELHLIVSREERHGRSGLMTHLARKSGLGVLSFWRFCQSWGGWQLVILGFIRAHWKEFTWPILWTLLIPQECVNLYSIFYHKHSQGWMDGCVDRRHLWPICVTLLCCWLLVLSPDCCWHWVGRRWSHFGRNSVSHLSWGSMPSV